MTVLPSTTTAGAAKQSTARRQIRGSSLLLVGKAVSMGIGFVVQVLIVRYLSKTDYGAFAYALSIVSLGETIAIFGLDRAITRFVPIYHERGDYNRLFGTIVMVVSTMLSLGLAMLLLLYGFQGVIAQSYITDRQALSLLLILIVLAPLQAFDAVLEGLFAVFASPKAIFLRKHVLGPGLRLTVVLLLVFGKSSVRFLAVGYLLAGALGVALYSVMLFRMMKEQKLFGHFNLRSITFPWREILWFTVPLLASDMVYVVMNTMDAVLLERFHGTVDVAAMRAVQPTAKLNQLVLSSFGLLFTPMAARLFARDDREGINDLYWQNAIWIAVVSFPIFALTFSLAGPFTVLLYGQRYEQSAIILALLSFGYYFNAALGQNGLTLKVFGKIRYIVTVDLLATGLNLGVNLWLIPRYGALGAAIGTTSTLVVFNILKQAGLALGTGINIFDRRYAQVYLSIAAAAAGLLLVQGAFSPPIYVSLPLAALVSLLTVSFNRRALNVGRMFPELLKLPLARRFFGD